MPLQPPEVEAASTLPEEIGFRMASVTEYTLSELGPWKAVGEPEATASCWESPDPHHPGSLIFYSGRSGGMYVDLNLRPIHFAGTAPRDRGFPRPEEAAAVGTPSQRWESSLSAVEWCDWMGIE